MRNRSINFLCSALLVFGAASTPLRSNVSASTRAQDSSDVPNAASIVKPHVFISLDQVPRGKEFQVAIVVDIAHAYHMNSHKPTDQYLIPTTLTAQLPAGFQLLDTIYPPGRLEKFSFSPDKGLDVYTGSVTLKLRLVVHADAPIGGTKIPLILRYQACNDTTCLPPVKVPVDALLVVAASDAKSRAMHPEIFSPAHPAQ
jgi:hypothetical protein